MPREMSNGDLPTLVLAVLDQGPNHGYAIAREVERLSDNVLHLREGSLYPALRVLEQNELVVSEWQIQEKGPARKVYTLTEKGHQETLQRTHDLYTYVTLLQTLLGKIEDGLPSENGYAE
jgi:PadR family transcriptional regulator PadR